MCMPSYSLYNCCPEYKMCTEIDLSLLDEEINAGYICANTSILVQGAPALLSESSNPNVDPYIV